MEEKTYYQQLQEKFENLIQENENIEILHQFGLQKQIEILSLQNKISSMVVARKNFKNIQNQFQQEYETILKIKQNIQNYSEFFPHVFMMCTNDKLIYMQIMDMDLFDFVQFQKGLQEQYARIFFKQLFEGVYLLHEKNLIHGDIKLENVLASKEGPQMKLCDFGHSCENPSGILTDSRGTSRYIEANLYQQFQMKTKQPYNGFKFDIFALGITLFEALCFSNFDQKILKFIGNNLFWEIMYKKYPKSQSWSRELKLLFVGMVNPDENLRMNIKQVMSSEWILNQKMNESLLVEDIVNQLTHYITINQNNRGTEQETQLAVQIAKQKLFESIKNEEYEEYLKLENKRVAQKIKLQALNLSCFKSQLSPQDLLTILLAQGDQVASNWQSEEFLDSSKYIMNATYNFEDIDIVFKGNQEMEDEDNDDDQYVNEVKITHLKFRIEIWEVTENKDQFQSWLQFTNLGENDEDSLNYQKHIHNIMEIIRKY